MRANVCRNGESVPACCFSTIQDKAGMMIVIQWIKYRAIQCMVEREHETKEKREAKEITFPDLLI
jgi:hypothetical protein